MSTTANLNVYLGHRGEATEGLADWRFSGAPAKADGTR